MVNLTPLHRRFTSEELASLNPNLVACWLLNCNLFTIVELQMLLASEGIELTINTAQVLTTQVTEPQ